MLKKEETIKLKELFYGMYSARLGNRRIFTEKDRLLLFKEFVGGFFEVLDFAILNNMIMCTKDEINRIFDIYKEIVTNLVDWEKECYGKYISEGNDSVHE